mgnify:CR=1 FL=1
MQKKLTAPLIKNLTPPKSRTELRDIVLPGFGLRYWQSKVDAQRVDGSWFISYRRPGETKKVRTTIGTLARYSLTDARKVARELFLTIASGELITPKQI